MSQTQENKRLFNTADLYLPAPCMKINRLKNGFWYMLLILLVHGADLSLVDWEITPRNMWETIPKRKLKMTKLHYRTACCFLLLLALMRLGTAGSADDLVKKADAGDAEAQFELGQAYEDGTGMLQDDGLAAKWYRKSAGQGNAKAENSLGVLYRLGRGVPQDKEEAFRWYQKAAQQGQPDADFNVAISYYNGDGV